MTTTEHYQNNWFAIIVLISSILLVIFLIMTAVCFMNLMNLKPPSNSISSFLFWTAIILGILFFIIGMYSLYHIYTYQVVAVEEVLEPAPPVARAIQVVKPPPKTKVIYTQPPTYTQAAKSPPKTKVIYTQPPTYTQVTKPPPKTKVVYTQPATANTEATYAQIPISRSTPKVKPTPIKVSNLPKSNNSSSSISRNKSQRDALNQELISLAGAESQ
jgi:hypothetical protein